MELTIKQIQDYTYCPKFYKLCHIDNLMKSKDANIENNFQNAIERTMYHFFYSVQDGTIPSLKELKKKFGDLYIGERSIAETTILGRSHRDLSRILENKSSTMLNNFYDKYSTSHGVPILIDKDYELKINNIIVKGNIPIIRETTDKVIEMLHFYVDTTRTTRDTLPLAMKYDISTIASSLAFESLYGNLEQHTCYNVISSKSISIQNDKSQYKRLSNMVTQISTAIQNKLFYPVMNNKCINCAYNKTCARI